ncbi:MAG: hypothetical protein R3E32_02930 [Chitinophagales bacterium]
MSHLYPIRSPRINSWATDGDLIQRIMEKNIIQNSNITVTGNFHQGDIITHHNYFNEERKIPQKLTFIPPVNLSEVMVKRPWRRHLSKKTRTNTYTSFG